ncbi:hypothetical protein PROFUN_16535 [Planoprotostelium fungivorum]|uniref:Uncharacterized protein n=1 Tax=Planoprotostelium fungivorum TaxID=1890364 RepID=A0A2P6MPJ9_9EUKA|nr:hypothetical protein PROFUN_16535 [Planoprotostelium fungivorum]
MSEVDMILTTAELEAGVEPCSVKQLCAVATPSAVHCVNIQMEDPVLTGLMNLIDCEYTQGTSPIENFNNVLASFQPRSQGYISLPSLKMLLQMAVFQFNLTKDTKIDKQAGKIAEQFRMMQYLTDIHHLHVIFATANVDNWTLEKAVDMGYRTKGDLTKWYHEHEKVKKSYMFLTTAAAESIDEMKHIDGSYISLPSLKMLLQMAVFQFNLTKDTKIDKQAGKNAERFRMMQYLTDIHHPHVIFATANVDNWTLEKAVDMGYRTKGDSTKWYHEHEKALTNGSIANETHEAIADRPDIAHQNQ